ncbi:hypothetical protein Acj9p193 [Acinetobacter phage Acj9]|uniref:Conserved hypothetical phage protein n=1 Tax=Acinetobacter phage Acj9 TaxID=760939 RepID=E5EPX7_9CAUD|nr:hypothetical protein Acj9p193 [Acinetobacter phage Acj9]ADG60093.1 conserved hypothetical phage protein [Acinetobacter phage Acj9]
MGKVSSFRSSEVKLTTDNDFITSVIAERWVVQFIGAPGIEIQTKDGIKTITNNHYVCPYRKFPFGWAIDPWKSKFLVKDFDFERGVVTVDGIMHDIEFYVDEKEYD